MFFRGLAFLLLFSMWIVSCGGSSTPPTNGEMEKKLATNIRDFEYLESFILENELTRLTSNSVFPKGKMTDSQLIEPRRALKNLGISRGVQFDYEDQYFEVLYWSTGILNKGQAKTYIKSRKPIENIPYLRRQMDSKQLECDAVKSVNYWYICLS